MRWFTVENVRPVNSTPAKTATFAAKNATTYLTFPKNSGEILTRKKKKQKTRPDSTPVGLFARTDTRLAASQSDICPSLAHSRRRRPLLALALYSRPFVLVWCWVWLGALSVCWPFITESDAHVNLPPAMLAYKFIHTAEILSCPLYTPIGWKIV